MRGSLGKISLFNNQSKSEHTILCTLGLEASFCSPHLSRIQSIKRGKDARKQADVEKQEKLKAITKMQAVYRGKVARKDVKQMREQQEEAATKIQAIKRGKDARKQADLEKQEKLKAITKMQAVYRGKVARKEVKEMREQQDGAAKVIADGVQQSLVVHEQQEQVHAGFDGCGTVLSVVALSSEE